MKDSSPQQSGSNQKSGEPHGRRRGGYRGRHGGQRRGLSNLTLAELRQYFVGCSCCGHFLISYQVDHGIEHLEQAGQKTSDGWVPLVWDQSTRELLRDIYGIRTDIDSYHLEAMCPECQRRIVYSEEGEFYTRGKPPQADESGAEQETAAPGLKQLHMSVA